MFAERVPLLVFAKAPRPGRVKTRLVPVLGEEGAARLYAAFLEDTWAMASDVAGFAPELWVATDEDAAALAPRESRVQVEGDLGARMSAAMSDALARAPRVVVIGSDAPTLPRERLSDALRALDVHEVVLGPSVDGGYYLVGARGAPVVFPTGVRWSTRHALADTIAGLGSRSVHLLRPHYDVDTPDDLRLLETHLALAPDAAPRTAAAVAGF